MALASLALANLDVAILDLAILVLANLDLENLALADNVLQGSLQSKNPKIKSHLGVIWDSLGHDLGVIWT